MRSLRATPTQVGLATLLAVMALPAAAQALTTLSQAYTTTDTLSLGSIVSLKDNASDEVSAATPANASGLLGVVIDNDSSLLSLTSSKSNQVQIATSGVIQVLVSNINGDISAGDQITASPVSGVGMKATNNAKVIGVAQTSLNGNQGSSQSYTDKSGKKHSMVLGTIPVDINVSYYYKQPDKTLIPHSLQNIANALAGKSVKPLPIILSIAVFIVTLIVVMSIIYSMIRSSIISVGRNPMSQSAVYHNVMQLSALVVGILAVAVVSIYMILTRL
jgi:hypothetical protein